MTHTPELPSLDIPGGLPACDLPGSTAPSEWAARLDAAQQLVESELRADLEMAGPPGRPEDLRRETELLETKKISAELTGWVERYAQVAHRSPYLWTWCRQGVEVTTLPGIAPELAEGLSDTKVLSIMFDVLLDDVADQGGAPEYLERLIHIPEARRPGDWNDLPPRQRAYAEFTEQLWHEIHQRTTRFPRYHELAELLRYDYLQLLNTMRYAQLLNRMPSLLNMVEHDLYLPHNMHMMISGTLDVMCLPGFASAELGALRQAVWHAQYMGRIGNLVTTWQRELGDRDFTSGVFARAVDRGDVTLDQLRTGDRSQLEQIIHEGKHEEFFLALWRQHRRALLAHLPRVKSVDLAVLVRGLERLICLHLASRGYK